MCSLHDYLSSMYHVAGKKERGNGLEITFVIRDKLEHFQNEVQGEKKKNGWLDVWMNEVILRHLEFELRNAVELGVKTECKGEDEDFVLYAIGLE